MPSSKRRPLAAALKRAVAVTVATTVVLGSIVTAASAAVPRATVTHTVGNAEGHEVINLVAVDTPKLLRLVPPGYTIIPASALGVGGQGQGLLVIANFQGIGPTVDGRSTGKDMQVAIDVGILVAEPPQAPQAGLDIAGAFHLYTLAIYTDDAVYARALQSADVPATFVPSIGYQRQMDDATGVGSVVMTLPARTPLLKTVTTSEGYAPMPGAFNAVLWHKGRKGTAALHFLDEPFLQGAAIAQVYTPPLTPGDAIVDGVGLGPCPPDPVTHFRCVIAPSLNLRYTQGTRGTLTVLA
jgi:hypothetical protein